MINTNRYQGPCSINGHRMWCGTCKGFEMYLDTRAGEWDWPYKCAHCDLKAHLPNSYPKWLRALEIIIGILGTPIRLTLGAIARLEDWLGDHIG